MQRFPLGRVVATRGALVELERASVNPLELIGRHVQLDPGSLNAGDEAANEHALNEGLRIFSAFEYAGVRYWVITEADRSATTLLLPEEY